MSTKIAEPLATLANFQQSVDDTLAKRAYLLKSIVPKLVAGKDYFVIQGNKSLGKSGAELLASLFQLSATFKDDLETVRMLNNVPGLVAYTCTLVDRSGHVVGEGRGAATLVKNQNDPNKTIKIAQKRAFVDSIIRSLSASSIFTQDVEDCENAHVTRSAPPTMDEDDVIINEQTLDQLFSDNSEVNTPTINKYRFGLEGVQSTEKQRSLIIRLSEKVRDETRRSQYLRNLSELTKSEASGVISELLRL